MNEVYSLCRDEAEIDDVLEAADSAAELKTTQWEGKSYEEGVRDTLCWLFGQSEDNPLDV